MTNRKNADRVIFDIEALYYDANGHIVPRFAFMRQLVSPPAAPLPSTKTAPVTVSFFPGGAAMYQMVGRMA